MPIIPTYDDHFTPQGSVQAQATPADFGAGVGAGLQHAGAGLDAIGQGAYMVQQDQERLWAYGATASKYEGMKKSFTDRANALDPSDPNFTANYKALVDGFPKEIDDATAELKAQAPTRGGAKLVSSHMAMNSRALLNFAGAKLAGVNAEYTGVTELNNEKLDTDSIAADPSNDNYARVLAQRQATIGGINTVDPVNKMKWAERAEHSMAVTQVQVMAATDAPGFLRLVNAQGGRTTGSGSTKGAVPGGAATASDTSANAVTGVLANAFGAALGPGGGHAPLTAPPPAPDLAFSQVVRRALTREGGYVAQDGTSGAPANFGINGRANPDVDIKNLTKDQAIELYRTRYWDAMGADHLPPAMQATVFDAAISQGVPWAKKALAQTGNDPDAFNAMRRQRYQDIAASDPRQQQYLGAWLGRMITGMPDGSPAGAPYLPATPSTPSAQASSSDAATMPQVQPLGEQDIAAAKPSIAGWAKLNWTEKVAAVRQAEAAVGGNLANDRAQMTRDLTDATASLLAGKAYPGLDTPRFSPENITRLLGPVDGPRRADQLAYVQQVGGFIGQMAKMPLGQAVSTLNGLAPQGGPEFADKGPVYQQAQEALSRLQQIRSKDFMGWAESAGVGNVKPIDFSDPDKFAKSLTARIPIATSGVTDYQSESHLFSKDEGEKLGDFLERANPQTQEQYIKAIKTATAGHDEWARDTFSWLAPKNTMLSYAAGISTKQGTVTTASGPTNADTVAKYVLEGARILQGKDLDDPTKSGRPLALDDKLLRTNFWNEVGPAAFASPDASRSAQIANDTYQAVKNYVAADIYHRGLDPRTASTDANLVKNAITAVTGGITKVGSGERLFRPWGMDENAFNAQFPNAVRAAVNASGLQGTPLDNPDGFHYVNVDEGKYLVTNGSQPLYGKNGRPVIVDMSQMPRSYKAPQAAVSSTGTPLASGGAKAMTPQDLYAATYGRTGAPAPAAPTPAPSFAAPTNYW